jgi:regulator of protease activity HflC (stomatin/prohibitin superfamily)
MAETYDLKSGGTPPLSGIVGVVVTVIVGMVLMGSFKVVGAGERGVVFSKISGIKDVQLGEGLHFKIPFIEEIITIDVKVQKSQLEARAASSDLQNVSSTVAVNYHVDPRWGHKVYQEIGLAYRERVIDPAVQESVKGVTAQYTAEALITKRSEIKDKITADLSARLMKFNILVDEFSIVDFQFSAEFNAAIEAKQGAEQSALKATRDLDRIKVEAEQTISRARAEAEAMRIQQTTLTPMLLQLRALEKWDGHLPTVSGGAVPFIDIDAFKK